MCVATRLHQYVEKGNMKHKIEEVIFISMYYKFGIMRTLLRQGLENTKSPAISLERPCFPPFPR